MNTDRRTVIAAGTALTALLATGACAQEDNGGSPLPDGPAKGPSGIMEIIHIYADEEGVSHVGKVSVQGTPKPLPVTAVVATSIAQGTEDWHQAPRKTFTINVVGDIECEVGDGTKIPIGKGDLVYLEDMTGKGHVTRLLTPVANLFLQMPDDFDIVAWANAPVDANAANG
ncbi:hypothetical protein GRI89_02065 [Altererythrobacter salegens]|uniref:Cupin domain-containing protein n=1 Tax=Croceibacterium salegens TaxID=1737568 RepID=A0A6I4STS8_9SPHN|nr:hypothetical protein [Croceibacterium salegens]MXO58330.1 hypothetical protein [Croceibacterium salegens]